MIGYATGFLLALPSSEDALLAAPAPASMHGHSSAMDAFPSVRGCLPSEVALRDALVGGPAAPAAWTL